MPARSCRGDGMRLRVVPAAPRRNSTATRRSPLSTAPAPTEPLSKVADDFARFPASAADLARFPSASAAATDDLCLLRSPSADPAISGKFALSKEVLAILDTVPAIESPLDCLAHQLTPTSSPPSSTPSPPSPPPFASSSGPPPAAASAAGPRTTASPSLSSPSSSAPASTAALTRNVLARFDVPEPTFSWNE